MTRALLVLVPLAIVGAAVAGLALHPAPALVLAAIAAVAVPSVLWRRQSRRVGAVAREVNAWLGHGEREPLELEGAEAWRELAVTINALGASHERRDRRLAAQPPWRAHVVGSVPEPALLFSGDDLLLAANPAARRLLRLPDRPQELTLTQALGSGTLPAAVRRSRDSGRPVQLDATLHGHDLRVTSSAIGDDVLVIVTDRTEQRRVEELRRDFVVNASHELKTPATAIQTLSEALGVALGTGSERAPELVSRLQEESQRLVRMVHDLLDLRRLEDRGPLETVPVDLAALVRETIAERHTRAEERGVTIDAELPDRASVAGVPADLRLVVDNLVANAIQYNRDGGSVVVRLAPDGEGRYVLTVSDTGVGIPKQALPRVFERFYRVDTARSRDAGGTGLGLSIVRHAVERHGGSVTAESLLGEGSTFTVRLPIERA
jgi:signal transduction histidine kinase